MLPQLHPRRLLPVPHQLLPLVRQVRVFRFPLFVLLTNLIAGPKSSSPGSPTSSSPPTGTSGLPNGWSYQGCWNDQPNGGRILAYQAPDSNTLTHQSCVNICSQAGYSIAGMEYSTQCFCGNDIIQGGNLASSDNQCAMTCSGDNSEICGGPSLMSIFSIGKPSILAPPVQQNTSLPGNWKYVGCLT